MDLGPTETNNSAVTVVRDTPLDFNEAKDLCDRLRKTAGEDVVGGASTLHGNMVLVNFSGLPNVEFRDKISDAFQHLEGNWGIGAKRIRSVPVYSYEEKDIQHASSTDDAGRSGQGPRGGTGGRRAYRESLGQEIGAAIDRAEAIPAGAADTGVSESPSRRNDDTTGRMMDDTGSSNLAHKKTGARLAEAEAKAKAKGKAKAKAKAQLAALREKQKKTLDT